MHTLSVDAFHADSVARRHLTALLDLVGDAVLLLDDRWRVVHLNTRAERAFDTRREHLVGKDLWQAWPHAVNSPLYQRCHAARNANGNGPSDPTGDHEFPHRFPHLDRSFTIRLQPIHGGLALFARDDTGHEHDRQARRDAEERFALAAIAVNDGIWDWNPQTKLNWWSPRCYELLGYAPGEIEMTMDRFNRQVHSDDIGGLWRAIDEHIDGRTPFYEHEFRIRHADGAYRWFHSRGLAVRDAAGQVVRMVGSQSDVTRRKEAEAATADGESRLRLALAAAEMVAWETDLATAWTKMSDGAHRLWGTRAASGHELATQIHPDDLPRVRDAWEAAVRNDTELAIEFRVLRPDGVRWYASRGRLGRDPTGNPHRMYGVISDVTERRQAADALQKAKDAAEHANRAKDQFLAVLSHELRTPLTPVLMAAATLEADAALSPDAREDVAMIRRNIELETRLIDDLLELSRIINGKMILQIADAPLNTLIQTVGQMVGAEAAAKGLDLEFELAANPDLVRGDAARLQQVVWNLLKNAIKFTPRGGRVRVRSTNPAPHLVRVELIDTGVGIDPAMLQRIFNAFEQAESGMSRSFGGLGLGLAISKAIADLHGATLSAHSDGKACGATFRFEIPTSGIPELLPGNLDLPPGALASPRTTCILLVEDHSDTRNTLQRLLQIVGYTVASTATMSAALTLTSDRSFDVLISDISLPDGTGWELIHQLRLRQNLVPAIAVSGFGMEEDIQRSLDAGFARHLTKPVNIKELQDAITSAVRVATAGALRLPPA
jgi:PAS domain S-box-containing protein